MVRGGWGRVFDIPQQIFMSNLNLLNGIQCDVVITPEIEAFI